MPLTKDAIRKLITDALKPLQQELDHLKPLKQELNQLKTQVAIHDNLINLYARKVDDLDQYSRRLSLVLKGFKRQAHESPASIRNDVIKELKRLGLDSIVPNVDRAHRYLDRSQHAVIVRFTKWHSRNDFFNKRFDCTWRIEADITDRRQELLDYARTQISENNTFKDVIKSVGIDRNCSLYAITITGKLFHFNSELEFASIISKANFMCRKVIHLHTFLRVWGPGAKSAAGQIPGPRHSSDCSTCDLTCYRDCKCACCCSSSTEPEAATYANVTASTATVTIEDDTDTA